MIRILLVLCVLANTLAVHAQQTYAVYLTDKQGVVFDPYAFFDAKAIERRTAHHIPLSDSTDMPLNTAYVSKISTLVKEVKAESRWLNALFVEADSAQVSHINTLSFVKATAPVNPAPVFLTRVQKLFDDKALAKLSQAELDLLRYQTSRMQASFFKQKGIDGKGMRIAVFDVGFPGVDKLPYFKHLRDSNRIVRTIDIVKKNDFVYASNSHGTATLSCIAGRYEDIDIGMATGAEFLLARTELATWEPKSEEYYWLAAAEWADRFGANIISSSLGYGLNRYKTKEMNGHHSIAAYAATMAAKKGILVVSSAGNEYEDHNWRFIITPSDADSVLCVGGTDPYNDMHIDFSSMGPSSSMHIKPNVSAPGHVITANATGIGENFGTSFSCPLTAGFAACAWQMNRQYTNMQLFSEIEKSAHLYPYFDYVHGYGIPQASYFTGEKMKVDTTFDIKGFSGVYVIDIRPGVGNILDTACVEVNKTPFEDIELKGDFGKGINLYYHVQSPNGVLKSYKVLRINCRKNLQLVLDEKDFASGDKLLIHLEGYTQTIELK